MAKAVSKVQINQASRDDIAALPGIGASTAKALIKLRDERGGFQSVDELVDVPGIGAQTLQSIRAHVQVTPTRGAEMRQGAEPARTAGNGAEGEEAGEATAAVVDEAGTAATEVMDEAGKAATELAAKAESAQAGTLERASAQQARAAETATASFEQAERAAASAQQDALEAWREMNQAWLGLLQDQFAANVQMAQQLAQSRTPQDLMEVQAEYLRASIDRMVKESTRVAGCTAKLASHMWPPLEQWQVPVAAADRA